MNYLKRWAFNLVLYIVGFAAPYFVVPDVMGLVFDFLVQLFGPWILVLFLLGASAPKRALRVKVVK